MNTKDFAISLVKAETEDEVIKILNDHGMWGNLNNWVPFGENENNFSTIGNQQSRADAALVEKIVNSIDAVLIKECLLLGIKPDSEKAPGSMSEAMVRFLDIKDSQLSYVSAKRRRELSNNIILAATGTTRKMNLTIADRGEGQTPKDMPDTILSINKSNKLKVHFVQGKFNMGGTGALPFCGTHSIQVIISKRCPKICKSSNPQETDWSITVIRKEEPRDGRRSSMYTYLVASVQGSSKKELYHFNAKSLPIIPQRKTEFSYEDMEYGTLIKMFDYEIQGYKSNILFDFNYRLSMLMPNLAHPVQLRECRNHFTGHTLEAVLSGLATRLAEDRQDNIEPGFPDSNQFFIQDQKITCSIYVLIKRQNKEGKLVSVSKNYREADGLIFTVNGQTHATLSESFFNYLDLSYLSDSLLVLIECSDLDIPHREQMFMNSRDRLRDNSFTRAIKENLREILRGHQGLRDLQNRRRAEAIHIKLGDDKPLQDVIQSIVKKSPVLSKILFSGTRLKNPFNLEPTAEQKGDYVGKKHPSYFKIKAKGRDNFEFHRPINHDFRVQFETDVENDYFSRTVERGFLRLYLEDNKADTLIKHLGLFNGIATLTIRMPLDVERHKTYKFEVRIDDEYIVENFCNSFMLITEDTAEYGSNSGGNDRVQPPSSKKGEDREVPEGLALPSITEVSKADWPDYNMNERSALKVKTTAENLDFFVNMDNIYLLSEIKGSKDSSKDKLTKARYKYCMALVGLSTLSYYREKNKSDETEENKDQFEDSKADEIGMLEQVSEILAPIIIPMIDSMAELNESDISPTPRPVDPTTPSTDV